MYLPFCNNFWPSVFPHFLRKFSFTFRRLTSLASKFFSCEAYLQTRRMRLPSSRWRSVPPSSSAHGSCTSTLTRWLVVIEPIVTCKQNGDRGQIKKKYTLTNVVFLFVLFYSFSFQKWELYHRLIPV